MSSQDLMNQTNQYLMPTYGRYPIALVRGRGVKAWDAEGKEYLDFLGGIAVNLLGHSHPAVVKAITDQASKLIHCSNMYYTEPAAQLAQLLVENGGLDQVFMCNSGAEANEGAFKLVRKYQYRKGHKNKSTIVSISHAFHGRTSGALAATPKPEIQEGFGPLPTGYVYAEFGDIEALKAVVNESTAAVILEPIQGEGGVHVMSVAFVKAARELCDQFGALLIFDEIQCGLGRTGSLFAYQGVGVKPDVITLAKGLGGGLPIGAICATANAVSGFGPGDHGTTFGGNPVACAAALATMKTVINGGFVAHAATMGDYLRDRLNVLREKHPDLIKEVRGCGLIVGIELTKPAGPVLTTCHQLGLLASVAAGTVLRLLPPYVVTQEDVDAAVEIIDQALQAIA